MNTTEHPQMFPKHLLDKMFIHEQNHGKIIESVIKISPYKRHQGRHSYEEILSKIITHNPYLLQLVSVNGLKEQIMFHMISKLDTENIRNEIYRLILLCHG